MKGVVVMGVKKGGWWRGETREEVDGGGCEVINWVGRVRIG